MKVTVTIEREDGDEDATASMGIVADNIDPFEVFKLMMAGAEMVIYDVVLQSLLANGAEESEAEYGAPLRTRLLATEILLGQPITPYNWVRLDMGGVDLGPEEG